MSDSKLLKLKTDLKSLKFDPNNEPYIQFPIGYTKSFEKNDPIPQSISDFYLSNRTNPDFPLRGGTIDLDLRTQTFTKASQIDRERIKKFYQDKPRGPIFLQKQIGLQLTNPKIETEGIIPGATVGLENTRFYNNGINTLVQVGVQGTGIHTVRHGATPLSSLQKAYYGTVNAQNINNSFITNRLVALKNVKLSKTLNQISPVVAKLGISLSDQNLFQYLGGPDSVYGVGSTTIKRYSNTEDGITYAAGLDAQRYKNVYRTYKQIDEISDQRTTKKDGIQSFPISQRSTNYGIGDPGSNVASVGVDRLNTNTLLYYDASTPPWEVSTQDIFYSKDIIKFVFEAIDNDNTGNATAVFFRAFLNSITDNHQASINTFKYAGRGEEFYSYQGAARSIGFSFKIAPQSAEELKPLYKKLNYLISQVYPDYSNDGIMRAPLMKLTIGDYFYRVPGLLESVNITIDDNVPWEINNTEPWNGESSVDLKQLPHVVNIQCTFKPIQDFLPRREKFSDKIKSFDDMNVPYISDYESQFVKGDILTPGFEKAINERMQDVRALISSDLINRPKYQTKALKYQTPTTNLFETQIEKDIRTGVLSPYYQSGVAAGRIVDLNQSVYNTINR